MEQLFSFFNNLIGLNIETAELSIGQLIWRSLFVYAAGLSIVRLGQNRFLGKHTAFDVILGFMLGSILSRAVNGSAPVMGTVFAAAFLVALHWMVGKTAILTDWAGYLVKGRADVLVRDGEVDWTEMRKANMTVRDLEEGLRLNGVSDPGQVALAQLERNGNISVLPTRREPQVLEIDVAAGVQTVRIRLE